MGALESLQKKYKDDAEIYLVYIREAHPSDGWVVKSNEKQGIVFKQPKALEDRVDIAHQMCTKLKISLPCLIDKIDNKVGNAYAGWPDRLYVIGKDGKIVYKGAPGPRGFKPAEADDAMEKLLATLE